MIEFFQLLLLILAIVLSFIGIRFREDSRLMLWLRKMATMRLSIGTCVGVAAFLGCLTVAGVLHEPVPRIHDEFSYLLMADTFASGHVTNPSPPLQPFFDTFHELIHPIYVSKYFPAQGVFLALGQKLTGHPAAGVWLSSALACAATFWMLEAWIGSTWALLGAILMVLQIGVFSDWSQSYWGGMVAALGGALLFGAIRRLWECFDWKNALWLAVGLVILANSRPLEGSLAAVPAAGAFGVHLWRTRRWTRPEFWRAMMVPAGLVLLLGATATGAYNRAITGSAWKSPYMVHEQEYQESPPLIYMAPRPELTYSSFWLWKYYHVQEAQQYAAQRSPALWIVAVSRKLRSWWFFYCGILLTPPLVLPGLLGCGKIRYVQIGLLVATVWLSFGMNRNDVPAHAVVDVLALIQIVVLWFVFDELWARLALSTAALLLFEVLLAKWSFPHYFAPATCLIVFLQIDGLRRIWHWRLQPNAPQTAVSRSEKRRLARKQATISSTAWDGRSFVLLLPLTCFLSLFLKAEARINDWSEDPHEPEGYALLSPDWSLRRADLEHWLDQQANPQLVFVRYSLRHNVYREWVFNRADLIHSHVIWARDLGTQTDRSLLQAFPDRTAWMVDADLPRPQLVPYLEAGVSTGFSPSRPERSPAANEADW